MVYFIWVSETEIKPKGAKSQIGSQDPLAFPWRRHRWLCLLGSFIRYSDRRDRIPASLEIRIPLSLTLSSPVVSNGYISKGSAPYRSSPPFLIFWHSGTLALRTERLSARMSKNWKGWVRPVWRWTLWYTPSCHSQKSVGLKGLTAFMAWNCNSTFYTIRKTFNKLTASCITALQQLHAGPHAGSPQASLVR